jgi:voltage-gated potassium channel
MQRIWNQTRQVNKNLFHLFISPHFIVITVLGNALIFLFSLVVFKYEHNVNSNINTIVDSVWWAYATATTVGYGDIVPVTQTGRLVGIVLMLTGTALFATYTALFAQAILGKEYKKIGIIEKRELSQNEALYNLKQQLKALEIQLEALQKDKEND